MIISYRLKVITLTELTFHFRRKKKGGKKRGKR